MRYLMLVAAAASLLLGGVVTSASAARLAGVASLGIDDREQPLVDALVSDLNQCGYITRLIGVPEITSSEKLAAAGLDLLVLPSASALPALAAGPIEQLLKSGCDILALQAPLWQRAVLQVGGRWVTPEEFEIQGATRPLENPVFRFNDASIKAWTRTTNDPSSPAFAAIDSAGGPDGGPALHVRIKQLTNWDTLASPVLESTPFRDGDNLTVVVAKGGPMTNQLAVEWQEKDLSRWIAVIPLTTEWRRYVIAPDQFKYWLSNPARASSRFNPKNAVRMTVGLAYTHMGVTPGPQDYYVSAVGTAPESPDYRQMMTTTSPPRLEILSPGYKFFEVSDFASVQVRKNQQVCAPEPLDKPLSTFSVQPRPQTGYSKGRDWRFIALLDALAADGQWRGYPAAMMVHSAGPYKGGVWATFGISGPDWYLTRSARDLIRQVANRMNEPNWVIDGGSNFYTYFDRQPVTLGATLLDNVAGSGLQIRLKLTDRASGKTLTETDVAASPKKTSYEDVVRDVDWLKGGLVASAELVRDGKVIDSISNPVDIWKPKDRKEFVTVKNGDFQLAGKRWRAHGVNYMPSSGIGTEDGEYFEHWIGTRSYDPEVIDRDLDHIQDLGLNAVSIFIYGGHAKAQNLLDLLRRLEIRGIKANLSLRPGTPMAFEWEQIKGIINYYRLWENDTVFAYDLAWEPMFGTDQERRVWDPDWRQWIVDRYGSIQSAERDWGWKLPLDETGAVTNPAPEQIDSDGPWRAMTAAYRRFLDTLLYAKYSAARSLVHTLDTNHLVSFRMAEAGNPNYRWGGRIPYDFPYLAAAVDLLAPEAYGRIGDWEKVRPGRFEYEYARWADPAKPMIWAEMGVSAWHLSRMRSDPRALDFQAEYFTHFYRLLEETGGDGIFYWWYPGGFRFGENSDYGITNPDGTDRPVSRVIREHAKSFLEGPDTKAPDHWLTFDRDAYPDGTAGIYDALKDQFWSLIDQGRTPGLRTEATGSTSKSCPNVAVGNRPLTGSNPHKYLDGYIDGVTVRSAGDKPVSVSRSGRATVRAGQTVQLTADVTNLAEASWEPGNDEGSVWVIALASDDRPLARQRLVSPLARHASRSITISVGPLQPGRHEVTLTMDAQELTRFGDRFRLTLEAK